MLMAPLTTTNVLSLMFTLTTAVRATALILGILSFEISAAMTTLALRFVMGTLCLAIVAVLVKATSGALEINTTALTGVNFHLRPRVNVINPPSYDSDGGSTVKTARL